LRVPALIVATLLAAATHAEGFDRSGEVKRYTEILTSSTDPVVITNAAKDISVSGISDPELAAKVKERLLADYPTRSKGDRAELQSVLWLVNALASFGIDEYGDTLAQIAKAPGVKGRLREQCEEQLPKIAVYRRRNEIMAQTEGFPADVEPRSAMFVNLLKSDDFELKKFAAQRASLEKRTDPIVMDALADQIDAYISASGHTDESDDAVKYMIRLLGYSGDPKHRAVLEKVEKSQLDSGMRKFAKAIREKHT
jgi:hypothetical protein